VTIASQRSPCRQERSTLVHEWRQRNIRGTCKSEAGLHTSETP